MPRLFQPQSDILENIHWNFSKGVSKNFTQAGKAFDSASYALHRVHLERFTGEMVDGKFWVPLHAKLLMRKIAGNWDDAKSKLLKNHLLVCDDKYIRGEKSLCYALGDALEGVRVASKRRVLHLHCSASASCLRGSFA